MIRDWLLAADHRVAMVMRWLVRRLGLRGAFLGAIATLDLIWAWSMLDRDTAQPLFSAATFQVIIAYGAKLHHAHPLLPWALLLGTVGLLCLWQAFVDDDRAAFAAAIGIKVLWALLTIAAWPSAHFQVLRGAAQWATLATAVLICAAGLPYRHD
jgi:hypothetical protein